ncbi:MAG: histidine kinase [Flavisolibacter sp.]|nr:histidine kinase [Flavisolibacter sp.]
MKDFINKPENFKRIEFWAATTIYVFLLFFLVTDALNLGLRSNRGSTGIAKAPFDYIFVANLVRITLLYLSFLFLNFIIVPRLIKNEALAVNIILIILVVLLVGFIYGIVSTYLRYSFIPGSRISNTTHNYRFQNSFLYASWLLLLFAFYSVIKYTSLYLLSKAEAIQVRFKFINSVSLIAFIIWLIVLFLLLVGIADKDVSTVWVIIGLSTILLYSYSFNFLIPKALPKTKPFRSYIAKVFITLLIAFLPMLLLAMLFAQDEGAGAGITFFNVAFQLFIISPLCWILFKKQMKGNEELFYLKKELGQSNASFDFLRSQINPHFLFNALNTIYGTAIQEKAERTSEGVERLGDMMRFMLQENMQEKISLAREIEYLNNYISLQKLRTDPIPSIKIEAGIEKLINGVEIAPMLLIPFVENAFKHGISFREPSHIKVTLEVKENKLFFDVYNIKHQKQDADPEKDKSGIGLINVKQRLQLLYPSKHELIIRETGKEFFVHLTIQLS